MIKVLITGATGFVGKAVLEVLSNYDVDITCVLREGARLNVNYENAGCRSIYVNDIFEIGEDEWCNHLRGIDLILHLAWFAKPGEYLTSLKNFQCLMGTTVLARAAAKAKVPRFVGIGTCFEYDTDAGWLSTRTALNPLTPYAVAKAAAFLTVEQILNETDTSFLWARLFYLHGENENPLRLVPYIHSRLKQGEIVELTKGDQVRDFLNVAEAAQMIVTEALGDNEGAANICSGIGITVRELAEEIADQYGRRDLLKFGARADNLTDPKIVVGIR